MRVNGEDVLIFKYDMASSTEVVMNLIGRQLLNVTYDALGRPLQWLPSQPFLPMQLSYDRFVTLCCCEHHCGFCVSFFAVCFVFNVSSQFSSNSLELQLKKVSRLKNVMYVFL